MCLHKPIPFVTTNEERSTSPRERRLAYLLYHCGLKPREIVRFCPQEWSDVQEIYRLRRNIFERLVRHADSIRWQLSLGQPWEEGMP